MPTEPSKFAENQFESATRNRFPLMSELLATTPPLVAAAAVAHSALAASVTALNTAAANWSAGESVLANAEAASKSATIPLEDKLASLTRKPDSETNSPLESWDATIISQVAYGGSVYTFLLPRGRETLTGGSIEDQLDALRDLGIRLAAQATKPTLVSLGTTVVTPFASAARTLRTTQLNAQAAVVTARANQELLRLAGCGELYAMVGVGMGVFKMTPDQVDTLFDVSLLRDAVQTIPGAPADIFWNPATRTLSTTSLPAGATRLEAWRQGPGGMPEQLAIGEKAALSVVIPASITFDVGDLYQLWLQARNSQGSSDPGVKVSWTAV